MKVPLRPLGYPARVRPAYKSMAKWLGLCVGEGGAQSFLFGDGSSSGVATAGVSSAEVIGRSAVEIACQGRSMKEVSPSATATKWPVRPLSDNPVVAKKHLPRHLR